MTKHKLQSKEQSKLSHSWSKLSTLSPSPLTASESKTIYSHSSSKQSMSIYPSIASKHNRAHSNLRPYQSKHKSKPSHLPQPPPRIGQCFQRTVLLVIYFQLIANIASLSMLLNKWANMDPETIEYLKDAQMFSTILLTIGIGLHLIGLAMVCSRYYLGVALYVSLAVVCMGLRLAYYTFIDTMVYAMMALNVVYILFLAVYLYKLGRIRKYQLKYAIRQ